MTDLITRAVTKREPLPIGELAPDFMLTSADEAQTVVTRNQFRGRAGILLFFTADASLAIVTRLTGIADEADRYKNLNIRIFVIVPSQTIAVTLPALPFPVLLDPDNRTWHAYSANTEVNDAICQYGLFLLDRYGGVDSELVTDDADSLPDAAMALEWARYAMYKCVC